MVDGVAVKQKGFPVQLGDVILPQNTRRSLLRETILSQSPVIAVPGEVDIFNALKTVGNPEARSTSSRPVAQPLWVSWVS